MAGTIGVIVIVALMTVGARRVVDCVLGARSIRLIVPVTGPRTAGRRQMAKQWYIVHTYSGHEREGQAGAARARASTMGKEELFDEILIPEENVVEVVKGEKRTSKRKFFPGYILVHMELDDETWHIVRARRRSRASSAAATTPTPISDEEVARMTQQIKEGAVKPKPKIRFEEGENVRVDQRPVRELLRLRRRGEAGEGEGPGDGAGLRPRHAGRARLTRSVEKA